MPKLSRRKKTSLGAERKTESSAGTREIEIPTTVNSEPSFQRKSIILRLAGDRHFVGAMHWMLFGYSTCGVFIAFLFGDHRLVRFFERFAYKIVSFVPKNFIPPDIYVPGAMILPCLFLIIIGFTVFGYRKGSIPFKIEPDKDTSSLKEKLFELFFLFALCLSFIFLHFWSEYPGFKYIEIISHWVFIFFMVIMTLVSFYYVFSRHQNQQLLLFVVESAIAAAFVICLLGLMIYTLFKSFTYALSH